MRPPCRGASCRCREGRRAGCPWAGRELPAGCTCGAGGPGEAARGRRRAPTHSATPAAPRIVSRSLPSPHREDAGVEHGPDHHLLDQALGSILACTRGTSGSQHGHIASQHGAMVTAGLQRSAGDHHVGAPEEAPRARLLCRPRRSAPPSRGPRCRPAPSEQGPAWQAPQAAAGQALHREAASGVCVCGCVYVCVCVSVCVSVCVCVCVCVCV
jgi:hypothetical protein